MISSKVIVQLKFGTCQARHVLEKRGEPLHSKNGIVRTGFLKNNRKLIMDACKANGLTKDAEDKLDKELDDADECISKTAILSVPQQEFIQSITDCNNKVLPLMRTCLKDSQKFYPDYMVDIRNSLITLMYANKDILASDEFDTCFEKMEESTARIAMQTCIEKAAQESHTSPGLPESKSEACETMDKMSECYLTVVGKNCKSKDNVNKFLHLYKDALTSPCKT